MEIMASVLLVPKSPVAMDGFLLTNYMNFDHPTSGHARCTTPTGRAVGFSTIPHPVWSEVVPLRAL